MLLPQSSWKETAGKEMLTLIQAILEPGLFGPPTFPCRNNAITYRHSGYVIDTHLQALMEI